MVKRYKTKIFTVDLIFICVCLAILLAVGVCVIALPHDSFSEEENRALATAPRFTLPSLLSGKYFEGISDFYADRIPIRTGMIRIKAACELTLGKSQNNGVIFSEDGTLIDRCEYASNELLKRNAERIKQFASNYPNATVVAVPRSVDVLTESESANEVISTLADSGIVDCKLLEELTLKAQAGEEVYYKTDHHLDSDGAYALYRHIVSACGFTPYDKSDFRLTEVSDSFLGTIYSKAGLLTQSADTVVLYRYEGDEALSVSCEDKGCEVHGLYCFEYLEQKDQYKIFLGGNHGVLRITDEKQSKPSLLLVKDSFANAVLPLLARHFDLTVYDPRYSDLRATDLAPESFDAVILLFGVDTIATTGLDF